MLSQHTTAGRERRPDRLRERLRGDDCKRCCSEHTQTHKQTERQQTETHTHTHTHTDRKTTCRNTRQCHWQDVPTVQCAVCTQTTTHPLSGDCAPTRFPCIGTYYRLLYYYRYLGTYIYEESERWWDLESVYFTIINMTIWFLFKHSY